MLNPSADRDATDEFLQGRKDHKIAKSEGTMPPASAPPPGFFSPRVLTSTTATGMPTTIRELNRALNQLTELY